MSKKRLLVLKKYIFDDFLLVFEHYKAIIDENIFFQCFKLLIV